MWLFSPQKMLFPTIPNFTMNARTFLVGTGNDLGFIAYNTEQQGWIISKKIGYKINLSNGEVLEPVFQDVNSYCYWTNSKYLLYYTSQYGWVLLQRFRALNLNVERDRYPGYVPIEYSYFDDSDERTVWRGDTFYTGEIPTEGSTTTFTPRGWLKDTSAGTTTDPITVSMSFEYWKKDTSSTSISGPVYGVYIKNTDNSDKKVIGSPQFKDENNERYVKSLYPQEDGVHYTYGAIHYEGGKWVIGTIGDANGWWEGQEPNIDNSTTFYFRKNDDSEATGTDKIISFEEYAAVTEKKEIYLGEIAIWH